MDSPEVAIAKLETEIGCLRREVLLAFESRDKALVLEAEKTDLKMRNLRGTVYGMTTIVISVAALLAMLRK